MKRLLVLLALVFVLSGVADGQQPLALPSYVPAEIFFGNVSVTTDVRMVRDLQRQLAARGLSQYEQLMIIGPAIHKNAEERLAKAFALVQARDHLLYDEIGATLGVQLRVREPLVCPFGFC